MEGCTSLACFHLHLTAQASCHCAELGRKGAFPPIWQWWILEISCKQESSAGPSKSTEKSSLLSANSTCNPHNQSHQDTWAVSFILHNESLVGTGLLHWENAPLKIDWVFFWQNSHFIEYCSHSANAMMQCELPPKWTTNSYPWLPASIWTITNRYRVWHDKNNSMLTMGTQWAKIILFKPS